MCSFIYWTYLRWLIRKRWFIGWSVGLNILKRSLKAVLILINLILLLLLLVVLLSVPTRYSTATPSTYRRRTIQVETNKAALRGQKQREDLTVWSSWSVSCCVTTTCSLQLLAAESSVFPISSADSNQFCNGSFASISSCFPSAPRLYLSLPSLPPPPPSLRSDHK